MKDLIIPVFISHEGCPHQCLFCNQQSIAGEDRQGAVECSSVDETIRDWLKRTRDNRRVQVAFYGGSFSCLPESRQHLLLGVVAPYLQSAKVHLVRISTRPDCINRKMCEKLYSSGVRIVELGCQSMNDGVLKRTRRGHSVEQTILAAEMVRQSGMELGVQLMLGLPGETTRSFFSGIAQVIEMKPAFVRLYPALVIDNTAMAAMYRKKKYTPLTFNRAIALTCKAYELLSSANIKVIRMGLQHSDSLVKSVVAGPYHESFGEHVLARSWFKRVRRCLFICPENKKVKISISNRDLSLFLGPQRKNMDRLKQLGLHKRFSLHTNTELKRGTLQYDFD